MHHLEKVMRTVQVLLLCQLSMWVRITAQTTEILHLKAEPNFRDVTLRWDYDRDVSKLFGFQVHYCELQAWGPHRCRSKFVDDSLGRDIVTGNAKFRTHSVIISGLRMSTNYSFEVWPMESSSKDDIRSNSKLAYNSIVVSTRGFSARATQCLPHVSEVEVATGPYFGGRIAVEAGDDERCAVDGDPDNPRDTYTLRIDHKLCGTRVNETTVATFVLVQENLPILTHSTRRFLVLCSFQPETLTVRAGINLPSHHNRVDPHASNRVENFHPDVMAYETDSMESVNDVRVSHLQLHQQVVETEMGKMLEDHGMFQLVLMVILVVGGVLSSVITVWWFFPGIKKHISGRSSSSDDDSSSVSAYENFENSVRDAYQSEADTEKSNRNCDIEGIVIHDKNESDTDSSKNQIPEDNNYLGVFTIRIPNHRLIQEEEPPCILIETNSHSEA